MKKLTSAEDAVKKAIEGGWGSPYVNKLVDFVVRGENVDFECKDGTIIKVSLNDIFTDPLFWTALGKVRGWGQPIDKGEYDWGQRFCLHCGIDTAFQPPRESGCNHVHYPEACKQCNDKKITAEEHSEEWFDTHVWHPDRETLFWQNLP